MSLDSKLLHTVFLDQYYPDSNISTVSTLPLSNVLFMIPIQICGNIIKCTCMCIRKDD